MDAKIRKSIREFRNNPKTVKFTDLLHLCTKLFGPPRIRGSHQIFTSPLIPNCAINLQAIGKEAKPYQVRQVLKAVDLIDGPEKNRL